MINPSQEETIADDDNKKLTSDNYSENDSKIIRIITPSYQNKLDHFIFFFYLTFYSISILIFNDRYLFLDSILYISTILAIYKFIILLKYNDIVFYFLKIISLIIATNIFIKNHNPFYNSLFFWVPFSDFLRGLIIIKFQNYFFEQNFKNLNIAEQKEILNSNYVSKLISYEILQFYFINLFTIFKNKKKFLKILSLLIIIKLSWFFITDNIINPNYKNKINSKKYFIAANLFNNENILDDWTNELLKLIEYLGKENVFISILENGDSTDKTAEKLQNLEIKLNVLKINNKIITNKIYIKNKFTRIDFLVELRNRVLEPIYTDIDWEFEDFLIIFFNDILYKYNDVINLIMTNDMKYDIVCGLDFYFKFYDRWVMRDLDGNRFGNFYPHFFERNSQNRVIDGEPIRVFSCWNGIAILNPAPFKLRNKFKFRPSNSVWESECFLLCYDYWKEGFNRILLNPNIKVTYEYWDYYMVRYLDPIIKIHAYFYYYFSYFFNYNPNTSDLDNFNVTMRKDWKFFI